MKEIPLTQGKVALVDDSDYEWLSQFSWQAKVNETGYWKVKCSQGIMSRMLLNAPTDMEVDHIDGNPFNNQRKNLRLATLKQNAQNRKSTGATSQYKGVSWNKANQKWKAAVKVDGTTLYLGLFTDEISAAKAYDKAALRWFGQFARLNF